MAKYRVKEGYIHGAQKQYKGGDVVELTGAEAAGFADKLELVEGKATAQRAGGDPRQGELVVTTPSAEESKTPDLRAAILAASDEELIAIPGIGEKSVEAVRAWARGEESTKGDEEAAPSGRTPATSVKAVEKELESETGHDFTQTGSNPPTLVETDKSAPESQQSSLPTSGENVAGENSGAEDPTRLTTEGDGTPKGSKGKSKP